MAEQQLEPDQRRVRVWDGKHVIESQVAQPDPAARYDAATRRRFACLLVTNEPVVPAQERA